MVKEDLILFPEIISNYKLNIDNIKIKNFLENIDYTNSHEDPTVQSDCMRSKSNILNAPELKELSEQIKQLSHNFIEEKFKHNIDLDICDSWATKTLKKGFSQKHSHDNSFLSGVYYPFGSDETKICFHKPLRYTFWNIEVKEFTPFNISTFTLNIKDNTLIFFKSYLEHEIVKYFGNDARYSIAFNIVPRGLIGTPTAYLNL